MIEGIGIDHVEVDRIGKNIEDQLFLNKLFSKREQEYCFGRGIPAQHYAARFAAKEAFLKALGSGLEVGFELHQIEVLPDEKGKPVLHFTGSAASFIHQLKLQHIHVSLSHLKETAMAVVIIEK